MLLGDEGFGVHLVRRLEEEGVPDQVDMIDGGTGGVDLLDRMAGYEHVIVCDAIRIRAEADGSGGEADRASVDRGSAALGGAGSDGLRTTPVPGEVVVFRLNTVELLNSDPGLSLHAVSLGGILRLGRVLGVDLPPITVVGYAPETVAWSTELSAAGAHAVDLGVEAVRSALRSSLP